jgi:nicotinate-nucleotide pyrophosphorylase (carboxylating)
MNRKTLEKKLLQMVDEDAGKGDITSELVPNKTVRAKIIAKEDCYISGVSELKILFSLFNINVLSSAKDGQAVKDGKIIFSLSGRAHDILLVERTALNILSRMSGVTSLTKAFVSKALRGNPKVRVAATRKTTPLFGSFEKKAVEVGGGDPHRSGLYDMVLIKNNHLKLFKNVRDAVKKARSVSAYHKVEIEVGTSADAVAAAEAGADIVMLDNMTALDAKRTIAKLSEKKLRKKILVEVSGGITLGNISEYASCGPDLISVGGLTHSAASADFALRIV